MKDLLVRPWPWWIAGPLVGLIVPALLLYGGKLFGVSSSLRHVCAALAPGRSSYFRYDWRAQAWNLWFVAGLVLGGLVQRSTEGPHPTVEVSAATREDLAALGITGTEAMAPEALFSWSALGTLPGLVCLVVGGFLLGFGARWGGGCTSGHAISGLANLQLPSLVAVFGFFAGGLAVTHLFLPWLLG